ncbi:guanine nucleotide-binding protein G(I)/G(S)/G(O) subunit gamma-T2b isoform X1 [Trachinotus anak]|uniref:guanine nucleotide-binding protein G(I)/G(S)/G(O) subunit gamma-T2b isoform X1 n=1 Tax=Trachinotus anak TaxID=443729 RepID=UPI0039F23DD1
MCQLPQPYSENSANSAAARNGVTAPDCLISSRGIGDIRPNPVPTSPKSQQPGISWDEEQWDSTDQSVRRSDRTRAGHTVDELLGANTFLRLLEILTFNSQDGSGYVR